MSGRTAISWTDRTWNPVVGCTKVSQGCKFCYAKRIHDMRYQAFLDGKNVAPQYHVPFEQVQLKPERLTWPLSLRAPSRIFVNSVSDLFHDDVPVDFIAAVWAVMALAPRHTYQVLTKRAMRMHDVLSDAGFYDRVLNQADNFRRARRRDGLGFELTSYPVSDPRHGPSYPQVWLGVSVENQDAANERVPFLLQTPAAHRFLSCEPLLGLVDLAGMEFWGPLDRKRLHGAVDLVIVGGESGTRKQNVRPMHPEWARSLRDQCAAAGVEFEFKQWGEYLTFAPESPCLRSDGVEYFARVDGRVYYRDSIRFWSENGEYDDGADWSVRVGAKRAGRLLHGRLHDASWGGQPA